jgi:hypothetical protein
VINEKVKGEGHCKVVLGIDCGLVRYWELGSGIMFRQGREGGEVGGGRWEV